MSGMFARLVVSRALAERLMVPAEAMHRRGQLEGVFIVGDDGRAHLRWIRTGRTIGGCGRGDRRPGAGRNRRDLERDASQGLPESRGGEVKTGIAGRIAQAFIDSKLTPLLVAIGPARGFLRHRQHAARGGAPDRGSSGRHFRPLPGRHRRGNRRAGHKASREDHQPDSGRRIHLLDVAPGLRRDHGALRRRREHGGQPRQTVGDDPQAHGPQTGRRRFPAVENDEHRRRPRSRVHAVERQVRRVLASPRRRRARRRDQEDRQRRRSRDRGRLEAPGPRRSSIRRSSKPTGSPRSRSPTRSRRPTSSSPRGPSRGSTPSTSSGRAASSRTRRTSPGSSSACRGATPCIFATSPRSWTVRRRSTTTSFTGWGLRRATPAPRRGEEYQAVTLGVAKRKGSDAMRVANQVMKKIEALEGSLIPSDIHVVETRNYGETASEKVFTLLEHLARRDRRRDDRRGAGSRMEGRARRLRDGADHLRAHPFRLLPLRLHAEPRDALRAHLRDRHRGRRLDHRGREHPPALHDAPASQTAGGDRRHQRGRQPHDSRHLHRHRLGASRWRSSPASWGPT